MAGGKILVTGATGTIGGQVVQQLAEADEDVRAIARNPQAARVPANVQVLGGDLANAATLDSPLHDVDTVFLIWPMLTSDGIAEVLKVVGHHARRVVYLSADGVDLDRATEPNPILRFHREIESAIRSSNLEWVCLRPASFASNTLGWATQLREGVVRQPFGRRRQAMVHEADIAAVAVRALTSSDLLGTNPVLTGPESLAPSEQVAMLGDALGIPARFEEISAAAARDSAIAAGWSKDVADALFDNGEPPPQETTSAVREITGRQPRSLRQWALEHADDFAARAAA